MTIIELKTGKQIDTLSKGVAVALGNFDGVHAGHRKVLTETVNSAAEKRIRAAAWCLLTNAKGGEHLTTPAEKAEIFKKLGLDYVIFENFEKIKDMSPEEFVGGYLESLGCKVALCGFNFRFGKGAAADSEKLSELCQMKGISSRLVPAVTAGDAPVSSTRIREMIKDGRVDEAEKLLRSPYFLTSTVTHGRRLGKTFGFPTINQKFTDGKIVPRHGVYFTKTEIDGVLYDSVSNVGSRPTVDGHECRLETHILGVDRDLYGDAPTVYFKKFRRPETKFSSEEELCRTVAEDVAAAKEFFQIRTNL